MAKWPRLTLQQILDEIFMGSLSEHNKDFFKKTTVILPSIHLN